ncbi:MAG: FAD-dependent oxidoreductase, partial [Alphaproteobacteria bacterium]|nr:FAD-dependent oxidoreductase [Alphaproteobacteria bacterium]
MKFDLCVIGAGPGGYVAAIRAAQLGLKVGIVEANHLGGICLNWGCIPTKALLKSAEVNHLLHNLDSFGFSAEKIGFDFTKVIERSRVVSKRLSSGIAGLMKKNKIEVINGFAKFLDPHRIVVSEMSPGSSYLGGSGGRVSAAMGVHKEIEASYFIIATGARARVIPGMEPDAENIWTYREAMIPKALPKSLLVVGSGAIGSEFASFYRNMGAEVTLIEMAENILPVEDEEISKIARKSFERQGIKVVTSAALKSLKKGKTSVAATVEVGGKAEEITAEKVIMAVGIVANVENLGLEKLKLKLDKGRIVANGYLETAEPNIFAIGDVVGAPWLAHKASHEGVIAAE